MLFSTFTELLYTDMVEAERESEGQSKEGLKGERNPHTLRGEQGRGGYGGSIRRGGIK